jgi:hypothetical protein
VSERDTFLARWLRLKRGADTSPTQTVPPAVPFDPATLPPIESLTSESDMSVFLQSGVPTEIARAALRGAWRADPAIRDFVGIAESQWDFNDPAAMPGFGPLEPIDPAISVVRRSVTPAVGSVEDLWQAPQNFNPQRDGQLDQVWLSGELAREGTGQASSTPGIVQRSAENEAPDNPVGGAVRRHGSALPKQS